MSPALIDQIVSYRQIEMRRQGAESRLAAQAHETERSRRASGARWVGLAAQGRKVALHTATGAAGFVDTRRHHRPHGGMHAV